MENEVGFGIIGAGMIAGLHADVANSSHNVKLVGVYDANFNAAKKFAEKYHCQAFENFNDFLACPEIRAVSIATPSGTHAAAAIPAAKAGKHILCEKPLEITTEKVNAIIAACDENNVLLSPVFQTRFTRPVQLVKDAMRSGRFGRMVLASAQMRWFREASYYSASTWRGTWGMDGGGALMNQAIHMMDLLIYINGMPEEAFAFSGTLTHSIEVEDNLCAAVKYRNGSFGTIEVSTSCAPGFPRKLEFSGSGGTVAIEEDRISRWEFADKREEDNEILLELAKKSNAAGGTDPMNITSSGHARQMEDLADSILKGREPSLNGREGRKAVDFICGIYESARTGKPYCFPRQ